ncbi:MAG TPA: isochorismatase family cysteine hydrolase [Coxiellaceae bacterium]|nr:MAG: isochorismatase [Gammaproteobacteria bacterium RIFCSPHIGHO2_12_FULL_36_30]HLB56058.1 isochorismatase family cysteine hydrolase [Coxiellaceae bacterium]
MKNTALLVIDFINDIVHPDGKVIATATFVEKHHVIEKANHVIAFAREHKIPIAFVKVGFSESYLECPAHSPVFGKAKELKAFQLNTWGTEFHEKLNVQPSDFVIIKNRVSAFYSTSLETFLRANQIQNIILTGVSTDMAIQSTAREAHDRDYKVIIVSDACGAGIAEWHDFTLKQLERLSVITTTDKLSQDLLQ